MPKLTWDPVPAMVAWNRLKSLRKSRGLSQLQVAAGAGVSITQIYFLELGHETRTTEKTKQKIASFFDVDVYDLFPCEMIGNKPREIFLSKVTAGTGHLAIKK